MGKNTWVGILIVGVIAACLMIFVWPQAISSLRLVRPQGSSSLAIWLNTFKNLGLISVGMSFFFSLLWYLLGKFVFKGTAMAAWWVIGVLAFGVAVIPGVILLSPVTNSWLAFAIYFLNNVLIAYWLSTALFSPDTNKYDPPFATKLRGNW